MSCGSGTFVKVLPTRYVVTSCPCNSWKCGRCGPNRRRLLRDQIVSGEPQSFLTLTWPARRPETPDRARAILGVAWKHLVARIKRRWPGQEFQYVVVVEKTKAGFPHLHIAFRGPYIPQDWLAEAWAELTGAYIVWIEACNSQGAVAGYLTKYLSKDPTKLGTGKRYWFSQRYRRQDASGRPADRPVSRMHWTRDHIIEAVVKMSSPALIPQWVSPHKCVLHQVQPP